MTYTVQQLAERVAGKVVGDGSVVIHAARPLREAGSGDITFLEHEKHARQLAASHASAVVIGLDHPAGLEKAAIQVKDPLAAFLRIFQLYHGRSDLPLHAIDPKANIDPTVRLGSDVSVHAFASIGAGTVVGKRCRIHTGVVIGRDCRLGDDVVLYPNVVLYDGTILGHRVMIHANAVIGADGFGYRLQGGRHVKVPHLGSVVIEDDVEIGACTTIDRGTFGATYICEGTKIDNLVQIAHNCKIGKHNLIIAHVGIAGSCTTGDYVVLAGQAGVPDHIHIGDRAVVGAQAGVFKDVPPDMVVLGTPARPEREVKRVVLLTEKLPEIRKDVRRIKKMLGLDKNGDE